MTIIYDAALLVAADRNDRMVWSLHREELKRGTIPVTTAPVVAQVSRSGSQALLRMFLRACRIVPFEAGESHTVGRLLAASSTSDVVDAQLVLIAHRLRAIIRTSDLRDLRQIAAQLTPAPPVWGIHQAA